MAVFTFDDAQRLIPEVHRLTQNAILAIEARTKDVQELSGESIEQQRLRRDVQDVVAKWAQQVVALGAVVKGLWLVDFDTGEGFYYCWKYPEISLEYWHTHEEGFPGRRLIEPEVLH